jgi:hypothetical protein
VIKLIRYFAHHFISTNGNSGVTFVLRRINLATEHRASFCSFDHAFSNYDERKPTNCILKLNHIFRTSILLLYVSALQERHLQGAQSILMKLCVCYVISAELSQGRELIHTDGIHSLPTDNTQTVSTPYRLTTHRRYPLLTD